MVKFQLLILCLPFLITVLKAQSCNNPLLSSLGITGESTPSAKAGISFCKSIKNGQTCCSADVMNGFQVRADLLRSRLINSAGGRDRYLVETLNELTPIYASLNSKLKIVSKAAFDKLQQISPSQVLSLYTTVNLLSNKAIAFEQSGESIRASLATYQKSRTTCLTRLIKLQAAGWCLACDPDFASKGVSPTGTVWLASKVCDRIKRGCYAFLVQAKDKSIVAEARILLNIYQDLITKLETIGTTGVLPTFTYTTTFNPVSGYRRAITMPSSCMSDTTCNWLCDNILKNAKLDEDLAGIGLGPFASNDLFVSNFFQRLLENDTDQDAEECIDSRMLSGHESRILQTGEWAPDDDEAGIDGYFPQDPGGILTFGKIVRSLTSLGLFLFLMSLII